MRKRSSRPHRRPLGGEESGVFSAHAGVQKREVERAEKNGVRGQTERRGYAGKLQGDDGVVRVPEKSIRAACYGRRAGKNDDAGRPAFAERALSPQAYALQR